MKAEGNDIIMREDIQGEVAFTQPFLLTPGASAERMFVKYDTSAAASHFGAKTGLRLNIDADVVTVEGPCTITAKIHSGIPLNWTVGQTVSELESLLGPHVNNSTTVCVSDSIVVEFGQPTVKFECSELLDVVFDAAGPMALMLQINASNAIQL